MTYPLSALASGVGGRGLGLALSGPNNAGTEHAVTHGYDGTGRFSTVNGPGGVAYTYNYQVPNSNLLSSISETSGWTETMTYEPNRDLLASIAGTFGGASKAAFAYGHDNLGRRTSVVQTGEMFARYQAGGLFTKWGYNERSEVTAAQSYYGSNINDLSAPVAARNFGYTFDNIGSRTESQIDGTATAYANNALNQLTTRTAPASTWVTGLAPTAAAVTVNGTSAGVTRQGEYYAKNVAAASTPLWQSLTASSNLGGTTTRRAYLAATPESYTYDLDGNLLDDGRWHHTWDAENRLTSMETSLAASVLNTGVTRQYLSFKYDYLGRRVQKTVANWNGAAYLATVDRKFIYDGWNLLAEHDVLTSGTPAVARYTWGLDLSKTLQDGGGVGGLLAIHEIVGGNIAATHLPAYDGNGNFSALVNRAGGALTAAYEYNAFGETLRASGSFAANNPFRFSTKYTDSETGLLYYGRRYYQPGLGLWLGRDPIEEKGGLHLYGFVGNNGVNQWDVLGMTETLGAFSVNGGRRTTEQFQDEDGCIYEATFQDMSYDPAYGIEDMQELPGSRTKISCPTNSDPGGNGLNTSDHSGAPNNADKEREMLKKDCDERARLAAEGENPTRWEGPVNYKFGAFIASFGRFEGVLVANEPAARTARITGNLFGVGVQGGYVTGQIDRAVWIGNSAAEIRGANGAFFNFTIGVGVGPVDIIDFDAEIAAHRGPTNADVSSVQGAPAGPGLSTTFDPANPVSYLGKPKVGLGGGGGVNGFHVTNFEITSDPCAGLK